MNAKLVAVAAPLALFAAAIVVAWLTRRMPSRPSLNAWSSLLLVAYLLATAGLGIFWVANQQLPVFDWHYLFGYGTLLLVALHLTLNLPTAWRWIVRRRGNPHPRPSRAGGSGGELPLELAGRGRGGARRRAVVHVAVPALAAVTGVGVGFWLGRRRSADGAVTAAAEGSPAVADSTPAFAGDGHDPAATAAARTSSALAVVERFHEMSTHTRGGLLRSPPNLAWRSAPPPFKSHHGAQEVRLPSPQPLGRGTGAGSIDRRSLATTLWHTAGITQSRGGLELRASPSSGALFSTELYVAARVGVVDRAGGVWHYDPQRQALAQIATADVDRVFAAAGEGIDVGKSQAIVVATAVFARTGRKYGDRTYRYVLADLGHALENLRLAAHASGVDARPVAGFDAQAANAAIAVDGSSEGALALLRLQPAEADIRRRAESSRVVLQSIAKRRSIRRFAASALPLPALLGTLAAATADDDGATLSTAVRIDVVAHAVAGLAPGAYRYDAASSVLVARPAAATAGPRAAARAAALDQDVIGDAQAALVFSIDRAAFAADPLGAAYGYRHAFLEAGRIGERVYLEAVAQNLGSCGVGAFYDDEAAALVGVDPAREWVVHFAALGVPAD